MPQGGVIGSTGIRRGGIVAVLLAGVAGLIGLQVAGGGVPADAAAVTPVTPGQVSADAALIGVVPQTAGLSLTTYVGQAVSAYNQTEAQATAATVNLGGLGDLLANSPFCGQLLYPTSAQPQPLTADSTSGASSTTSTGNVGGAGTETVSVSPSPEFATASANPAATNAPGLLSVTGSAATAVHYLTNTEQEAQASVVANLSLAGVVQITGMHWLANRTAGQTNTSSGTFSFGTVDISVLGVPTALPSSDSLSSDVTAINNALAVLGISIALPAESVNTTTDTTSISPLVITFRGSSLENEALAPTGAGVAALEAAISGEAVDGTDCAQIQDLLGNVSTPTESVANLLLGSAEGAGGVQADIGGAEASVQSAPNYTNPFGGAAPGGGALPVTAPAKTGSISPGSNPAQSGVPGTAPVTNGPAPDSTAPPVTTPATATDSGLSSNPSSPSGSSSPDSPSSGGRQQESLAANAGPMHCSTTSPADHPGCWRGLGSWAAGTVIVLGAGMLAADIRHNRRSIRRRPSRRAQA